MWKVTYDLVVKHGYEIVYIDEQTSEVWLAKNQRGEQNVLRIVHKELNWRNELKRDVNNAQEQIRKNNHLFRGGRTHLHCIFISEYPPVDEWEEVEIPPKKRIKQISVYYLDDQEKVKEQSRFFEKFQLEMTKSAYELEDIEYESQVIYLKQQVKTIQRKRRQELQEVFSHGKTVVAFILIVINLILFALMEWKGNSTSALTLIEFGAKYNPAILNGEWWRIVTSMFLHIGIVHLLMNMLALFYLGIAVEKIYGSTRFLTVYFLAGIFGGTASFMLNPQIAAGASGAIFGLFGALLFFGLKNKRVFFQTMGYNLIMIIGINIAFGIIVPQIDNGAHVGGLIGGFIASMMVGLPKRSNQLKSKLLAVFLYSLLMVSMISIGVYKGDGDQSALSHLQISQELNEAKRFNESIETSTKALHHPGDYEAELLFNRSYAYFQNDQLSLAKQDLTKVIELQPEMAEAHFNLALIYQSEGDLDSAKQFAEEAANLQPDHENFQELINQFNNIE
nr:rhomboid family intramembrane serine protease [Halobacillus andaensis]